MDPLLPDSCATDICLYGRHYSGIINYQAADCSVFVDDLVDTGETFKQVYKSFKRELFTIENLKKIGLFSKNFHRLNTPCKGLLLGGGYTGFKGIFKKEVNI